MKYLSAVPLTSLVPQLYDFYKAIFARHVDFVFVTLKQTWL